MVVEEAQTKRTKVSTKDVRVDTYRDSGPGGQHRNKTDSAVRMTHKPSGIVVTAVESRSQAENREVAWKRLQSALDHQCSETRMAEINDGRNESLGKRGWNWTSWRDEVNGPGGRSASMKQALKGRLQPLL